MSDYSDAHDAVEAQDLEKLLEAIRAGADIEEIYGGISLLQHAIDVESCGYHNGQPLHVDMTALLLAMGADPLRPTGYDNMTAQQMALESGHWLASILIDTWARYGPTG